MPNLHVHYYHGNVKAFRAELDGTASANSSANGGGGGGGGSGNRGQVGSVGSAGRSWTLHGLSYAKADPNERDALGRRYVNRRLDGFDKMLIAASSISPRRTLRSRPTLSS